MARGMSPFQAVADFEPWATSAAVLKVVEKPHNF